MKVSTNFKENINEMRWNLR